MIYRIIIYIYEWSCRVLAPCGSLRNRLNYSEKELQNIEKWGPNFESAVLD